MKHRIPTINDASLYARTDMQQLTREIMKIEGIRSLNRMIVEL